MLIKDNGYFCFRLGKHGYGFMIIDRNVFPPMFSTRYGYRKEWSVGHYSVQWLRSYK